MTYQSFCNIDVKGIDESCQREFTIVIEKGKYITQDDIHFKIEYSNINKSKIDKCCAMLKQSLKDYSGNLKNNLKDIESCRDDLNNLFKTQIENIKEEHIKAAKRQIPLFHFQNVELLVNYDGGHYILIARRMISSLEERIVNNSLYLNQLFPGIQFKYSSDYSLKIKFMRSIDFNECLKFECHYELHDMNNDVEISLLKPKYEESMLFGTLKEINANFDIDFDYKNIKIVLIVDPMLSRLFEPEEWKNKSIQIKKQFKLLKLKYFKNGLEVDGFSGKGRYHIEGSLGNECCEEKSPNTVIYLKIVKLFD